MKVEQAKQIASNAIDQLRQALEAGHSGALKEYLAAMARFRRYSWHNVMLIASQKPSATYVAGFQAWHKLGRFVKKGEKGILILAPIIRKKAQNNGETEPDESSTAVGFRAGQGLGKKRPAISDAIRRADGLEWETTVRPQLSLSGPERLPSKPGVRLQQPHLSFSLLSVFNNSGNRAQPERLLFPRMKRLPEKLTKSRRAQTRCV
jgi:N-terminal domain of anti-restriction factor ArdC